MVISRITDIIIQIRENETMDRSKWQVEFKTEPPAKDSFWAPPESGKLEDCLVCRLIGGSAASLAGLLCLYEARRQPKKVKYVAVVTNRLLTQRSKMVMMYALGSTLLGLGGLRFAGIELPDFEKALYQDLPEWILGKEE